MRITSITILFFLITFPGLSKTTTATIDGNWTTAGIWDNGLPVSGDIIIIKANVSILGVVNLSGAGITTIEIQSGGDLAIYGFLNINGGDGDSIIVRTGGTISIGIITADWGDWIIVDPGAPIIGPAVIENGTLPIELISFDANLSGEVVEISWITAAEIDNDYFTLERSEDGINWNIIGEEKGAGNSTVRLDYRFVDYNPIPGLSYYRLKQTDYDGQFEYFTPAVVLYEPDNLFKVFPNPTTDYIQLTTSIELNNAVISIQNMNGQAQSISIEPSNHQANIDLSGLPAGVYLLEIVFPESALSKRIVKK